KIYDLWTEYNECSTKEAKLVKAMDKLETIVQHNQGDNPKDFNYEFNLSYGKQYFEDDDILKFMRNIIDEDTKESMASKNVNINK
ncbi:MAG: HD domain-containing protein, partial [Terrisporobacter sp.]